MLGIVQRFGIHCICHLKGEFLMVGRFRKPYMAGSRWRVGLDGADWWSGRAGCYPMGEEHAVKEKRLVKDL